MQISRLQDEWLPVSYCASNETIHCFVLRSKSPPSDDYDDFLSQEDLNEDLSDVDAAAAMMVLKHGPHVSLNSGQ